MVSLSMFGEAQVANLVALEGENRKRIEALTSSLSKSEYSTDKSTYMWWVKYFVEGPGQNIPYQFNAFLAYWINYFMFPSPLKDNMHPFIFPMVVSLAQGRKLALEPWYFGSIYARLTIVRGTSRVHLSDITWCLMSMPTSSSYSFGNSFE